MRIRRLAVPIAITSALVVLGGVTAGLIWAWSPAPSSVQSNLQAANLPVEPPAAAEPMSMTWSSAPSESEVKHSARVDSAALGGSDVHGPATASDDTLPTLPEKPDLKYPNLGSNLDQLVASVEEGETSAKEATEDAPVHQEASVAVTIYLSGNLDDVVKFLEDNGGSPRNVGEDYIEAYVPVSLAGAGLGTARRHPGAGNRPGGAGPERASGHRRGHLISLTDRPHRIGRGLCPGITGQSSKATEDRGAEVARKIGVLAWNRSPKRP